MINQASNHEKLSMSAPKLENARGNALTFLSVFATFLIGTLALIICAFMYLQSIYGRAAVAKANLWDGNQIGLGLLYGAIILITWTLGARREPGRRKPVSNGIRRG